MSDPNTPRPKRPRARSARQLGYNQSVRLRRAVEYIPHRSPRELLFFFGVGESTTSTGPWQVITGLVRSRIAGRSGHSSGRQMGWPISRPAAVGAKPETYADPHSAARGPDASQTPGPGSACWLPDWPTIRRATGIQFLDDRQQTTAPGTNPSSRPGFPQVFSCATTIIPCISR